jgi:hypothetical protein
MANTLKKDLQTLNREVKGLSKKIEKMIVAVDKLEKAQHTKSKAAKKAPAKKKAAQAKPAKKAKTQQPTAIDTVFGFVQRSKKGVDTSTLVKKTGFNRKKIGNIIFKLKKQGKITSPEKGVYLKA